MRMSLLNQGEFCNVSEWNLNLHSTYHLTVVGNCKTKNQISTQNCDVILQYNHNPQSISYPNQISESPNFVLFALSVCT